MGIDSRRKRMRLLTDWRKSDCTVVLRDDRHRKRLQVLVRMLLLSKVHEDALVEKLRLLWVLLERMS